MGFVTSALILGLAAAHAQRRLQAPTEPNPCASMALGCQEPIQTSNCSDRKTSWSSLIELGDCQMPVEVRVGMTVSMTGNHSLQEATDHILSSLRNLSVQGHVNFVSIGLALPYCLTFCVLDDESLAWKAVEHYRSFAGGAGYASSVDFMLSPSTFDFRLAAAQVADEYQRPLISWTLPFILAATKLVTTGATAESMSSWLWDLFFGRVWADTENVYGRLPDELTHTCDSLVVPTGYTLRPTPEFLPCDGPCTSSRDLDYCAVPAQNLDVAGNWSPPTVLRHGGWYDGCLEIVSDGERSTIDMTLHFETPRAMVDVQYTRASSTGPVLVLGSRFYTTSPGALTLVDGINVKLDADIDDQISLMICLRADCMTFTCPSGYIRAAAGTFCSGANCTAEDLETCCTLDDLPLLVNGPFWNHALTAVLDASVPPLHWLDDALPRLLHPLSQFVACVPQDDPENIFVNLCKAYIQKSLQVGFRTLERPLPSVNADPGVHHTIVDLMLKKPSPTLVIVCSDMETFGRFIHGLVTNQITFLWVMSCIPFGEVLHNTIQGGRLVWNFLQPTPWPSVQRIMNNDHEFLEHIGMDGPGTSLAAAMSLVEHYTLGLLALRSGVQLVHQMGVAAIEGILQQQTSSTDIAQLDTAGGMELAENFTGVEFLLEAIKSRHFKTCMGTLKFDQHGRRQIQSRQEVGMRQSIPLPSITKLRDYKTILANESWLYIQADRLFSNYRDDFSADATLQPYYLPFLADKMSQTYPCPPGCMARSLQCFSCPPGTFRQASSDACSPCHPNASQFQDQWAGNRCFNCPVGGTCESPIRPPVANPGFVLLEDVAFRKQYADVTGKNACSREPGGGLSTVYSWDLSRWYEAKSRSSWVVLKCTPPEACIGSNRCHKFHTGPTCSGCVSGSTKYEWYFFKLHCVECPSVGLRILQISLMAVIQVTATIVLSQASRQSAWDPHSLAGPLTFSFFRTLQAHAILSKLMLEPVYTIENEWVSMLIPFASVSQMVFAPLLLPLASCLVPLQTESDLMVYHLLQMASRAGTLIISCLLTALLAGRGYRLDALIRTGYTGIHFAGPSLAFYSLMLGRCVEGWNEQLILSANHDIPCPAFNLAHVFAVLQLLGLVSTWIALPLILRNFMYRHMQDRFGMGIHRLLQGRRFWKILDDICIAIPSLLATVLGQAGTSYCLFATEGGYALLTQLIQAYTFLCGNLMVMFKKSMALNLVLVCSANLCTDFLLGFISDFLQEELDQTSLICKSLILIVSLVHMLLVATMAWLENGVALKANENLLTAPAGGWTKRFSRSLQGFASFHRMQVTRHINGGGQITFDARESHFQQPTPEKHRKVFMYGLTSAVRYTLNKSRKLRLTEVHNMVSEAVDSIVQARQAQVMFRWNQRAAKRGKAKITEEEDKEFCELLQSDLVAPHALVSTVEDMCDVNSFNLQGKKIIASDDHEGWLSMSAHSDEAPVKNALALGEKKYARQKNLRKYFVNAQVKYIKKGMPRLIGEVDDLIRRLGGIWAIATQKSHSEMVSVYLGKAQALLNLLHYFNGFFDTPKDARDPAVEEFLSEVLLKIKEWMSQVDHMAKGLLDKDLPGAEDNEAQLKPELQSLFQSLFGEAVGPVAEATLAAAPVPEPLSHTVRISVAGSVTSERPRMALPFNSIDFESRTKPAPSRHPELDW